MYINRIMKVIIDGTHYAGFASGEDALIFATMNSMGRTVIVGYEHGCSEIRDCGEVCYHPGWII